MELQRLFELAWQAGVRKDHFRLPKFHRAWLCVQTYRCLVRECWGDPGHGYDIVSSEYRSGRGGAIGDIYIVLSFCACGMRIQDLGVFLARQVGFVPASLRRRFRVWIGSAGDENGGILVEKGRILFLSREDNDHTESEDCFANEIVSPDLYRAGEVLLGFIRKEFRS